MQENLGNIEKKSGDMKGTRLTIDDVAREAGVGRSTVSRVINGAVNVNEETRKKIVEVMARLNFTPNAAARATRISYAKTIGFVYGQRRSKLGTDQFNVRIFDGIAETVANFGYDVVYYSDYEQNGGTGDATALEAARSGKIDGVIMTSDAPNNLLHELLALQLPTVIIDPVHEMNDWTWYGIDNRYGMRLAMNHLYVLGHTSFAFIGGDVNGKVPLSFQERYEGFQEQMELRGLRIKKEWIVFGDMTKGCLGVTAGFESMMQIIDHGQLPTAVIAANDLIAMGAMQALYQKRIRIPEQVSIIGFDNIYPAEFTSPPLTSISVPKEELGQEAALAVISALRSKKLPDKGCRFRISPQLVVRETTAAVQG